MVRRSAVGTMCALSSVRLKARKLGDMIGGHSRTARRIAGLGTCAPENALNDAANDWARSLGRS